MRRRRRPIRRRMPRKNTYSYLRPFIALLLLVSVGYYVFGFFWGADSSNGANGDEAQVTLFVEKGSAKILLWGEENWDNAPDGVKLFQGDTVKTDIDSRVRMAFFDQSIVRLDERSRVSIESVDTSEGAEKAFQLDFEEGEIWAKIEKNSSEEGSVDLFADAYKLSSNGGTFSLTEDTIRCISGRAEVDILNIEEGVVLKTTSIGVGQEIVLTQEVIDELKTNNQAEVLSAISDNFEQSEWYEWNQFKDGNTSSFDENQEGEEENEDDDQDEEQEQKPITFTKPFSGSSLIAETVNVTGSINEETIVAVYINNQEAKVENGLFSVSLELKEGRNSYQVFVEDKEGIREQLDNYILVRGAEKPQSPQITVPNLGSDKRIEITSDVQEISGIVPANTEKVIVSFYDNGSYSPYELGKYEPGATSFTYYARTSIGNLKSGENRYRVYTEDQAGTQSQPIEFTIVYTPQEEEEEVIEAIEDTQDTPDENDNTSTGTISINPSGLSVTQPAKNDGKIVVNQAPIYLKGKTFSQTKRITINGKIVSTFTPGNSTWAYKLDLSLGNLREGSNNLTITAYDEDGSELGSITEVVEYVVEKISAPIINRPTTDDVFESENKRITIGGRCSSRSTKIYVNGEIISYKKGETDWSTEVELVPGDNNFSVYAEDSSGNKSSATRVTVIYSPEVSN